VNKDFRLTMVNERLDKVPAHSLETIFNVYKNKKGDEENKTLAGYMTYGRLYYLRDK